MLVCFSKANDFYTCKLTEISLSTVDQCEQRVGDDCYEFQLTGIGARVAVTSAHLWLYKTRDVIGHHFADTLVASARNQTITVRLMATPRRTARLERAGERGGGNSASGRSSGGRILASVNVRRRSGCWVRVNVHRAVMDHTQRPSRSSPGLRLAVECRGGCVLARGRPTAVGGGDRRPVLVVDTLETGRRRSRRTLGATCPPSHCCLHSLYIDFALIGWNFIRQPPGYYINYCHGPCNCKLSVIVYRYIGCPNKKRRLYTFIRQTSQSQK